MSTAITCNRVALVVYGGIFFITKALNMNVPSSSRLKSEMMRQIDVSKHTAFKKRRLKLRIGTNGIDT